jgi:hypothetical protein
MQTALPQRALSHSLRVLKRARGHPRQWPPAPAPAVPAPTFPVASVQPLPSGWAPPLGPAPGLPFRVRVCVGLAAGLCCLGRGRNLGPRAWAGPGVAHC